MEITVRNNAGIANKYIRLLKWKLYSLNRKFNDLHYADIFIKKEGNRHSIYEAILRLGIPGNDIILKHRSPEPSMIIANSHRDARRYLAKRSKSYKS